MSSLLFYLKNELDFSYFYFLGVIINNMKFFGLLGIIYKFEIV